MQLEKEMYKAGWIFAFMGIIGIVFMSIFKIDISDITGPCIFHTVTGLYCPGCGGTRAVISFLKGDLIKSFLYHPVVPYAGLVYILFMIRGTISFLSKGKYPYMRFSFIYIYIGIAIIIIQFIIKNFLLMVYGYTWL